MTSTLRILRAGIGTFLEGTGLYHPEGVQLFGGGFTQKDIEMVSMASPAAFVGIMGGSQAHTNVGSLSRVVCAVAIACHGEAGDSDRHDIALDLVNDTATAIQGQTWGLSFCAKPPMDVTFNNLYKGSLDDHGVALWQVSWEQDVRLGNTATADDLAIFETFYAKWKPTGSTETSPNPETKLTGLYTS